MKKIFSIIITILLTSNLFAQTVNDIGKIALTVVMPDNVEGLTNSQLSKLETKIAQIVTSSGLDASGYNDNFVVYPIFSIYETNVVEGGMQNITVINSELSLFIKEIESNVLFSSISKQLKGSGNSKELAITNAISKIPTNDPDFKFFIETGKSKIINYYETKCEDIIIRADGYIKTKNYEQALGLLMSVPELVSSCYDKVHEKSILAYNAYQTQKCSELIQKANSTLASNNFESALDILANVNPSSTCFNEAQKIVQNIAKTIQDKIKAEEKKQSEEEAKQWEFKMKQWEFQAQQHNDEISLEKERINAAKEVAISYNKNQPKKITYNILVKQKITIK
jgi:hypothetical protein